jgi:hypothetical protein
MLCAEALKQSVAAAVSNKKRPAAPKKTGRSQKKAG